MDRSGKLDRVTAYRGDLTSGKQGERAMGSEERRGRQGEEGRVQSGRQNADPLLAGGQDNAGSVDVGR